MVSGSPLDTEALCQRRLLSPSRFRRVHVELSPLLSCGEVVLCPRSTPTGRESGVGSCLVALRQVGIHGGTVPCGNVGFTSCLRTMLSLLGTFELRDTFSGLCLP